MSCREHAGLRLQAWIADQVGLRTFFGPTGIYRQYYDRIPKDPSQPIDDSAWEQHVCAVAQDAIVRIQNEPWDPHVLDAAKATAQVEAVVGPFLHDYASIIDNDTLPTIWMDPEVGKKMES